MLVCFLIIAVIASNFVPSELRCVPREADPNYDYESAVSNVTESTSEAEVTDVTDLANTETPVPESSFDQVDYPSDSEPKTEETTETTSDASPAEQIVEEEYKEQPVDDKPMIETTSLAPSEETSLGFPEPSINQLSNLVDAAKGFINEYITPKQWKNLKVLLKTVREIGGSRSDTHRTVNVYLARILTPDQKKRIMARQKELFRTFNNTMPVNLPRRRE